MSKVEILAELAHLSDEERADVRAWLDRMACEKSVAIAGRAVADTPRLRSPRLANPATARDFKKQVISLE